MSFDELDFFGESDNGGSGSGSRGESVGSNSYVGFGYFVPDGIESLGSVVPLVVFVPRGFHSKGCRIIGLFWRPKY